MAPRRIGPKRLQRADRIWIDSCFSWQILSGDLFVIFLGYRVFQFFQFFFSGYALNISSCIWVSAYVPQLYSSIDFTTDLYNLILIEVFSLLPFIQTLLRLLRATVARRVPLSTSLSSSINDHGLKPGHTSIEQILNL